MAGSGASLEPELAPPSMHAVYKPPGCREKLPNYKLPGYTGFIPQNAFQCEKRSRLALEL